MRNIEDGKLGDALRMQQGDTPGDGGAPVVAGEKDARLTEMIGDGENVGSEMRERVVGGAAGFAGCIVAALIGNDDAEAGGGESFDLLSPGIPEFGEAVEEEDDRTVWWAGGDGVELDRAIVKG
jgi:hypothetical protein